MSMSKKSKSGKQFCSSSCAATYNNTHKSHGTRRSKLEKYIELELGEMFPNLEIHFNRKDAINSELDVYIPSLKLAFELNGVFHYMPIYGEAHLNKVKMNDGNKIMMCINNGIKLEVIDSSGQKNFSKVTSTDYIRRISSFIRGRISDYSKVDVG